MTVVTQSLPASFSNFRKVEIYIFLNISDCIAATKVQEGVPTALAPTQSPQTSDASDIAALMPTATPIQLLDQGNDSGGIATMMVQEDVLTTVTTQVPQPNDGMITTIIQEEVPTTQAPTHAPPVNNGRDTVHYFKYR